MADVAAAGTRARWAARLIIADWKVEYSHSRSRSVLAFQAPARYAGMFKHQGKQGDSHKNLDHS